jgi:hypothetical protein
MIRFFFLWQGVLVALDEGEWRADATTCARALHALHALRALVHFISVL